MYHSIVLLLNVLMPLISVVKGNGHVGTMTWCTVSDVEQNKCENFADASRRVKSQFGDSFLNLRCHKAYSFYDCMTLVDNDKADVLTLDPGEVYVAGRYHSLIPIMFERYDGMNIYYAVAVVRQNNTSIQSLRDLRNKKACFPGVGTHAGWNIPLTKLIDKQVMKVTDCNNYVKTATHFFNISCAPNSLLSKYNPLGDNSDSLCELCEGLNPGQKCTSGDLYAGFEGALDCLLKKGGDVAFVKHSSVLERMKRGEKLELICLDGSRRSPNEYAECSWGEVPAHALVTSTVRSSELRSQYQDFLMRAADLFGSDFGSVSRTDVRPNSYDSGYFDTDDFSMSEIEQFNLFASQPRYQGTSLLFQDETTGLVPIPESEQSFSKYLDTTGAIQQVMEARPCPIGRMTLCVTSPQEFTKCIKMKTAMKAQMLRPELICYEAHSTVACMRAIRHGDADVAVLDAGDVYVAGLKYDLIPFMSEVYNLGTNDYYVVAVVKQEDVETDLLYLRDTPTCHTGLGHAAGWVVPMSYLISNSLMREYGCDSVKAGAQYFTKACVPGAMSTEYNHGSRYHNLCQLCHGSSSSYCARDATEGYFGHAGAFRCLVEGGGKVAFVKHTTVSEIADGKRREYWARNQLSTDYELLCRDGTRAPVSDYKTCNIGYVKGNAIVTRGGAGFNKDEVNAYINVFRYAQQYYGQKYVQGFSFSMFSSPEPQFDLIFQDATQQLMEIPENQRSYRAYLGRGFLRAQSVVDCTADSSSLLSNLVHVLISILFLIFCDNIYR